MLLLFSKVMYLFISFTDLKLYLCEYLFHREYEYLFSCECERLLVLSLCVFKS